MAAVEEALVADPRVEDPEAACCFVDVLVCAQHRGARPGSGTCPNATDVGQFEAVVDACARLVLFCTPLTRPKALTRVWCLFELKSAMERGRPVLVALGASDRAQLRRLLREDFGRLEALFTTIRSADAEATVAADRAMIFGWIERDLGADGFRALDQMVAGGMRAWLAEAALGLVAEAERAGCRDFLRGVNSWVRCNNVGTNNWYPGTVSKCSTCSYCACTSWIPLIYETL